MAHESNARKKGTPRPKLTSAELKHASAFSREAEAARPRRAAHARSEGVGAYVSARKTQKKALSRLKVGILSAVGVVLIASIALGVWLWRTNSQLQAGVDAQIRAALANVKKGDPFYMLLLGVDKSDARAEDWGSDTANFRSDTIMLARIDPKAKKIWLISIPRDTQVDMGEHGVQKLNAAYSIGGTSYMISCVSKLAGVDISHFAEVDFEQFTSIVDSIGGITVNLPIAIDDPEAAIDLPAGTQTLNGAEALGLSRSRHAYDTYGAGDYYRAANQRMVLMAIAQKVLKLDVVNMANAVSAMAEGVSTDFDVTGIVDLAYQFKDIDASEDIYSAQMPTESSYENGVWYEKISQGKWNDMMARIEAGEKPYADGDGATTDKSKATATLADESELDAAENSTESYDVSKIKAVSNGNIQVQNATSSQGLAGRAAKILKDAGFVATAANHEPALTHSVLLTDGSEEDLARAKGVAEALGLTSPNYKKIDSSYSAAYDVICVLGSDYLE